ncbi:MAG: hypothetical protein J0I65_18580 [Variovorax sp.]|nr:hypothetical protein [Variovorax sp.]
MPTPHHAPPAAQPGTQHARLTAAIARHQAALARSRSERPARIAAQRQAALYRELACEGRA